MPIQKNNTPEYPVPTAIDMLPLVIKASELVFADLETTGFGAYDDITEIGAVRVDIETGKIVERFSSFVHLKTQKKVPAKIVELTGITTQMLEDAPRLETVLPAFLKFVGDSVLSFHNATFDWPFLQRKCSVIGQTMSNHVICTAKLFRYLHPKQPAGLAAVTSFYGTPIKGHHRAYVDSKWSAACYRQMRNEILQMQDQAQLSTLTELPAAKLIRHLSLEDLLSSCIVHRIAGWEKGGSSRIYCTTSVADFYYDLTEHIWNVSKKKIDCNIDVNILAQFILQKVQMDLAQFERNYALTH